MATVTCRECGKPFLSDAFVCPHCKAWRGEVGTGARPTHEPSNRILQTVAIALMAITLVCTVGVMLLWNSTPLPSARPPETSRPAVQELAQASAATTMATTASTGQPSTSATATPPAGTAP